MDAGVTGDNGMLQAFPPNTGVGWYTMATGAYPAEHGSTNNTFFRAGDAFNNRTSFSAAGVLQADTIANAAERAGKKVAQIDWVGGVAGRHPGPDRRLHQLLLEPRRARRRSRPGRAGWLGLLRRQLRCSRPSPTRVIGPTCRRAILRAADATTAIPTTAATRVPSSCAAAPVTAEPQPHLQRLLLRQRGRGGVAYDHAIVSPVGKTGAGRIGRPGRGRFRADQADRGQRPDRRARRPDAGHYVKLISLAPDASQFKLYRHVAVTRDRALRHPVRRPSCGCGRRGPTREVHRRQPPAVGRRRLRAARGRSRRRGHLRRAGSRPRAGLQPPGHRIHPRRAAARHRPRHGRLSVHGRSPAPVPGAGRPRRTPTATRTRATTSSRSSTTSECTGTGTAGLVETREEYIRSGYVDADEKLGFARELMGGNPTTFAGSDHGFAPQWYAVNANKVLNDATVGRPVAPCKWRGRVQLQRNRAGRSGAGQPVPPVSETNTDMTKACWAGGTIQIYINPARLDSTAQPTWPTYCAKSGPRSGPPSRASRIRPTPASRSSSGS